VPAWGKNIYKNSNWGGTGRETTKVAEKCSTGGGVPGYKRGGNRLAKNEWASTRSSNRKSLGEKHGSKQDRGARSAANIYNRRKKKKEKRG